MRLFGAREAALQSHGLALERPNQTGDGHGSGGGHPHAADGRWANSRAMKSARIEDVLARSVTILPLNQSAPTGSSSNPEHECELPEYER